MRKSLSEIVGGRRWRYYCTEFGDQLDARSTTGAEDRQLLLKRMAKATSHQRLRSIHRRMCRCPSLRHKCRPPTGERCRFTRNGTDLSLRGRARVQAGGPVDRVQNFNLGIRFARGRWPRSHGRHDRAEQLVLRQWFAAVVT